MVLKEFKNSSGNSYATVSLDEENNTISDVWVGSFGSQDRFKEVIEFIKQQILDRKITKWLADLRLMKGSFDSSKEWMVKEVMPELIQNGLLYEAVIIPENIFSKLSVRDTAMQVDNFTLRQFGDFEEGSSWLKSF